MRLDQQEDRHPVDQPTASVKAWKSGETACGHPFAANPKRVATAARFGVAWLHA